MARTAAADKTGRHELLRPARGRLAAAAAATAGSAIAGLAPLIAIAERGRHDELLTSGGRYAGMWAAQQITRHWSPGRLLPARR